MNVLARTHGIPKEDVNGRRSYGCICMGGHRPPGDEYDALIVFFWSKSINYDPIYATGLKMAWQEIGWHILRCFSMG